MVFHSSWWLAEHWGRAFELVTVRQNRFGNHGVILLRKKPVPITVEELERMDPREPREVLALRHNIAQLGREASSFQAWADELARNVAGLERERAAIASAYERTLDRRVTRALRRLAGERRDGG